MAEDPRDTTDPSDTTRPVPLIPLLSDAKELAFAEFHRRLEGSGHDRIRQGHGCVFRFIDSEGTRLTTLAERAGFSKQAVGEIVDDLERLGYTERVPDPFDRRAKLIRLSDRGRDAYRIGLENFDQIEREWAERFGAERVAVLRELLEEMVAAERAAGTTEGSAGTAPAPAA